MCGKLDDDDLEKVGNKKIEKKTNEMKFFLSNPIVFVLKKIIFF